MLRRSILLYYQPTSEQENRPSLGIRKKSSLIPRSNISFYTTQPEKPSLKLRDEADSWDLGGHMNLAGLDLLAGLSNLKLPPLYPF